MKDLKIVYYMNQFFGGEGGEESASEGIAVFEGTKGISGIFESAYGGDCKVAATIICGDNYIAENLDKVCDEIIEIVKKYSPDAFVAGPAYAAGRYGVACGALCTKIAEKLSIPTVTAMNELNPGVQLYHKKVYILKTGDNARAIKTDVEKMAAFVKRILAGETIGLPDDEGYFARGYKRNKKSEKTPPERAVDMLLDKFYNREFTTEIPLPSSEDVPRPNPIKDLSKITVALATDGGLYPIDNPDNMPTQNADRFGAYDISGMDELKPGEWKIRHNGFDNTFSNADPNRLVPVDSMREMEREGVIGKLYDKFLATTGLVATVENSTKTGKAMVDYVKEHNIDAVVLTST